MTDRELLELLVKNTEKDRKRMDIAFAKAEEDRKRMDEAFAEAEEDRKRKEAAFTKTVEEGFAKAEEHQKRMDVADTKAEEDRGLLRSVAKDVKEDRGLLRSLARDVKEDRALLKLLVSKMGNLEDRVQSIENTVIRIENNHGEHLKALHDGYVQNAEKITRVEDKVDNLTKEMNETKLEVIKNSEGLKRVEKEVSRHEGMVLRRI